MKNSNVLTYELYYIIIYLLLIGYYGNYNGQKNICILLKNIKIKRIKRIVLIEKNIYVCIVGCILVTSQRYLEKNVQSELQVEFFRIIQSCAQINFFPNIIIVPRPIITTTSSHSISS